MIVVVSVCGAVVVISSVVGCWRYARSQPLGFRSKVSLVTGMRFEVVERERYTMYRRVAHRRSELLIVSFAGAALQVGGFPKKEFRRSLQRYACDQLFLMDPAQSFFLDAPGLCHGRRWQGYTALEQRLRRECAHYKAVMFIGCSMGASGVLLFSHLATAALAFNPLVDLDVEGMRPRFPFWLRNKFIPAAVRRQFKARIHSNLQRNKAAGGRVHVHYSNYAPDVRHINTLPADCTRVYHPGCNHHNTAQFLKQQGRLAPIIDEVVTWARNHSRDGVPASS